MAQCGSLFHACEEQHLSTVFSVPSPTASETTPAKRRRKRSIRPQPLLLVKGTSLPFWLVSSPPKSGRASRAALLLAVRLRNHILGEVQVLTQVLDTLGSQVIVGELPVNDAKMVS
jgi:hypothetical protein